MANQATLSEIRRHLEGFNPVSLEDGRLLVNETTSELSTLSFELPLTKLIWPTREGELITNISALPTEEEYRLTYPGTASTKSMILYTEDTSGVVLIAHPTLEYARLAIQRLTGTTCRISITSRQHHFVLAPFTEPWADQVAPAYDVLGLEPPAKRTFQPPKLFLQIGVKDPYGNVGIEHFSELKKPIDHFLEEVGPGHLVHFFGTNEAGFDRMFPDYSINETLGGKEALAEVVAYAKEKGLLTSHHFVPRIADSNWIKENPECLEAAIKRDNGEPVIELYKNHPFYVMDPSHPAWYEQCMNTLTYLSEIGFDYIELDQFTYQRNFPAKEAPIHEAYQRMIDDTKALGVGVWLEGLCDAFKLDKGDFFQILVRDRKQLWDDHENRRGYIYGESHPQFIMTLRPDAEVSYQVITENNVTTTFPKKLETARAIHAEIYDLQMDFYNDQYIPLLKTILGHIRERMHDQLFSPSHTLKHTKEQLMAKPPSTRGNKVAICHYRIGKTDGVSLEIAKRKRMLTDMGYEVTLIAGSESNEADYIIPELEFDIEDIVKIKQNAFFAFKDYESDKEFAAHIDEVAGTIRDQFLKIHEEKQFDYLFLHNIFSHGRHIAAAKSFTDVAKETDIQVIAVNHDFYSVGSYVHIYKPQTDFVREFLEEYVPPVLPEIQHVTINSLNREALLQQKGIDSMIIPDTFDFEQPAWRPDDYNKSLLEDIGLKPNDIVVLQATRVVERKAIELAIDFVKQLNANKDKLVGKALYNGKEVTKDSRVVLVMAGYTEPASAAYREKLEALIEEAGIEAKFIDDRIDTWRAYEGGKKLYSLWDSYVFADIVTYPSVWEGWGNQFIEAVFAKKPVVVFEYPVFKADIEPEGYEIISLGDELGPDRDDKLVTVPEEKMLEAVAKAVGLLIDPKTPDVLEKNWQIGKERHSDDVLGRLLTRLLTIPGIQARKKTD